MVTKRKTKTKATYLEIGPVDLEPFREHLRQCRAAMDEALPPVPKGLRKNVPLPLAGGDFVRYGTLAQRDKLAKAVAAVAVAIEALNAKIVREKA